MISVHILRNHFRGGGGARVRIILITQGGRGSKIGPKFVICYKDKYDDLSEINFVSNLSQPQAPAGLSGLKVNKSNQLKGLGFGNNSN